MAFISRGTPNTTQIVFNSGYIDFGNEELVMVENVDMSVEWTLAYLYVLGSIKPQDIARHSQKVTLTGKIKSWSPSAWAAAAGSSGGSAPTSIYTFDGQPTKTNPVATFYDENSNEVQYQFSGAVFKSIKNTLKMEDYAEFDFELEATDVTILSTVAQ